MKIQLTEQIWLNDQGQCTTQQLAEVSGLSEQELSGLIDHNFLVPADVHAMPKTFPLHAIVMANRARRLRDDFELESNGLLLVLSLLGRIEALQEQVQALKSG